LVYVLSCEPHSCCCGLLVDAGGLHSITYKQAPGRSSRHHMLNDLVARALAAAGVPAVKEPAGLVRQDGKRPDGLTLIPYANGRSLTWDVTVVCSTADSYINLTVQRPGSVAEMAASRKEAKYAALQTHHIFQPIAVEILGVPSMSLRAHFWTTWADEFLFCTARTESICFYFNAFLLPFSVLTSYCCTTVFHLMTTRTSVSTSNFFVFLS